MALLLVCTAVCYNCVHNKENSLYPQCTSIISLCWCYVLTPRPTKLILTILKCFWRLYHAGNFSFPIIYNANMADARTCQLGVGVAVFLKVITMLTNSKYCKSVIIIIASDPNSHAE